MRLFARDMHPGLRSSYFQTLGLLALTVFVGVVAGVTRLIVGSSCSS